MPEVGVDRSGLPVRSGGIPGFWDGYREGMSGKDLERECRMSKKVD